MDTLRMSATPFYSSHPDFEALDVRGEHITALRRLARDIEDELEVSPEHARALAQQERVHVPSAYAIALMMNFLTTPNAVGSFESALTRLMQSSLVPGGILIVLGGTGQHYPEIYSTLDRMARSAGLVVLDGFEAPRQAGSHPDEAQVLTATMRAVWELLSSDSVQTRLVEGALKRLRADDIFDRTRPLSMPRFKVRVYRRGRWPNHGGTARPT
jgi:hypothetical protein